MAIGTVDGAIAASSKLTKHPATVVGFNAGSLLTGAMQFGAFFSVTETLR
jgi:hypothetical protein